MVKASDIEQRVRALLLDAGAIVRLPEADLLAWLNEALEVLATQHPLAIVRDVTCETVQRDECLHLFMEMQALDGMDGTAGILHLVDIPEAPEVSANLMDREDRGWRTRTTDTEAPLVNWARYSDSREGFYSYPALPANTAVTLRLAWRPATFDSMAHVNAALDERLTPVLVNYVVYRALRQDADSVANAELASVYELAYKSALEELKAEAAARWSILT